MRSASLFKTTAFSLVLLASFAPLALAQPGAAAGGPLNGLSNAELTFFSDGQDTFSEVDSVSGTEPGATGVGLGPRFNSNSCANCHAYPAVGGSSPASNPLIAIATRYGAKNTVPSFLTPSGPVRAVRFRYNADGTRDGGVHALYTISGRSDAPSCKIAQPDFAGAINAGNISYRIPTPIFGAGLVEAIPDAAILANKTANASANAALGIAGHENRNGNDGTITRFGWKAQNKATSWFAGEAYNVEQGVTNEFFPNERDETPGCVYNGIPEDHTNFEASIPTDSLSDVVRFTNFMRFLAPPTPSDLSSDALVGQGLFTKIGCANCHTVQFQTGLSSSPALSNKPVKLYSDLLLHHMGPGLSDDIIQGNSAPDEFRSAPLWGVSQRLFFLHDGRATTLNAAILAHASGTACSGNTMADGSACASEANAVITAYKKLVLLQQQQLIAFLKAL